MSGPPRVIVEADGGSRGNPGPAGYGAVVFDASTGEVLAERRDSVGIATNNVAEYSGLVAGLTAALELDAATVAVRMDSKLVVEQMSGRWQIKHPALRPLAREAARLAAHFDSVSYEWIPRARNAHADRLANAAMDEAAGIVRRAGPSAAVRAATPAAPPVRAEWAPSGTATERPTRVVLLRHGQTRHSPQLRFSGRNDLSLDETGQAQARRAAERVARLRPDVIVSSPLPRTRETAAAVAAQLGTATGVIVIEDGFVETDFGDWEGLTPAEIATRWGAELTAWQGDHSISPPGGGESLDAVGQRARKALRGVLRDYPGQTVVVVSHVTPIKLLLVAAIGGPPDAVRSIRLDPAGVSVIDYHDTGAAVVRVVNEGGLDLDGLLDQAPTTQTPTQSSTVASTSEGSTVRRP